MGVKTRQNGSAGASTHRCVWVERTLKGQKRVQDYFYHETDTRSDEPYKQQTSAVLQEKTHFKSNLSRLREASYTPGFVPDTSHLCACSTTACRNTLKTIFDRLCTAVPRDLFSSFCPELAKMRSFLKDRRFHVCTRNPNCGQLASTVKLSFHFSSFS